MEKGNIVDFVETFNPRGSWGWWGYPIVEYNVNGIVYTITSRVGYNKAALLFRKNLTVLYNPNNPS